MLEVPGQPVPGPAHPGRLPPVSGAAAARRADRLCRRASHDAAGAGDQACRVGRALRASDRVALADDVPVAADVAVPRAGRRRDAVARVGAAPRRATQAGVSLAVPSHCPAWRRPRSPQGVCIESTPPNYLRASQRGTDAPLGSIGLMSVCVHE